LQLTPKEAASVDAHFIIESKIVLMFDNSGDRPVSMG